MPEHNKTGDHEIKPNNRFPADILATIRKEKILGIRAGRDSTHRVIGIWAVVVDGRVFVRSWSMQPRSWWRTFLEDPYGGIFVGNNEIPVRAKRTQSERLKDLVSAAYKEKYNTPGSVQYVKDMSRKNQEIQQQSLCLQNKFRIAVSFGLGWFLPV